MNAQMRSSFGGVVTITRVNACLLWIWCGGRGSQDLLSFRALHVEITQPAEEYGTELASFACSQTRRF